MNYSQKLISDQAFWFSSSWLRWISNLFLSALIAVPGVLVAQNVGNVESKSQSDTQQLSTSNSTNSDSISNALKYSVDQKRLESSHSADDSFWLEVDEHKLLVLKYFAEGRKFQGDLILLPAQGEHPNHPRIVSVLSTQMQALGWQVFVPVLPLEDFSSTTSNVETSSLDTSENKINAAAAKLPAIDTNDSPQTVSGENPNLDTTNSATTHFFTNADAYQDFFDRLMLKLRGSVQPQSENTILVANQSSAYWTLAVDKSLLGITHLVLIAPQIPDAVKHDLPDKFSKQTIPVFAFVAYNQTSQEFREAFRRNLWSSPRLRINKTDNVGQKFHWEDTRLARKIDGWVRSKNRKQ